MTPLCPNPAARFLAADAGQDMVEYALIFGVVVLGGVIGVKSLANVIANLPNDLINELINAYNS